MLIELDPVDHITADAVGPPGERVFYLQGRKGDHLITVLVEKQQVQLLAASVVEILSRLGKETAQGLPDEEMGLESPVDPEWRAGRLSIGYEEDRDLIMLEAEELLPEETEPGSSAEDDPLAALGVELDVAELIEEPGEAEEEEEDEALTAGDLGDLTDLERIEDPEGVGPDEPDPARVRFWATREQMLSLARHGATVCAQGRPRCQLCGNPIDPKGHQCPALNGHGGGEA